MSSGDHFSRRMASDFFGRNTSSIRFARDMIGGIKFGDAFFIASTA